MKNAKNNFVFLLVFILCATFVHAQKSRPYPTNADDLIASVELFSQKDFSAKDAFKLLGTLKDDELDPDEWAVELTPIASERERIYRVRVDVYDEQSKLVAVEIEYVEPVLISYGKLRLKYGKPRFTQPPKVMCLDGGNDCHPAFVGYTFSFAPQKTDSDKKVGVLIVLEMEWSKRVPKHTDKNFLRVKKIRFRRLNRYDE